MKKALFLIQGLHSFLPNVLLSKYTNGILQYKDNLFNNNRQSIVSQHYHPLP